MLADEILYDRALYFHNIKVDSFGRKRMEILLKKMKLRRQELLEYCTVDAKPFPATQLRDGHHMIATIPGIEIGGWKLKDEGDEYWSCCGDDFC